MPSWSETATTRSRGRHKLSRATRLLAVAGTFLLLSVQLTVAVHSHPGTIAPKGDACAQLTVDSSLCPLCLLAFHLPVNPVSSTAAALPPVGNHAAPALPEQAVRSFALTSCPTRAPPRAA